MRARAPTTTLQRGPSVQSVRSVTQRRCNHRGPLLAPLYAPPRPPAAVTISVFLRDRRKKPADAHLLTTERMARPHFAALLLFGALLVVACTPVLAQTPPPPQPACAQLNASCDACIINTNVGGSHIVDNSAHTESSQLSTNFKETDCR